MPVAKGESRGAWQVRCARPLLAVRPRAGARRQAKAKAAARGRPEWEPAGGQEAEAAGARSQLRPQRRAGDLGAAVPKPPPVSPRGGLLSATIAAPHSASTPRPCFLSPWDPGMWGGGGGVREEVRGFFFFNDEGTRRPGSPASSDRQRAFCRGGTYRRGSDTARSLGTGRGVGVRRAGTRTGTPPL